MSSAKTKAGTFSFHEYQPLQKGKNSYKLHSADDDAATFNPLRAPPYVRPPRPHGSLSAESEPWIAPAPTAAPTQQSAQSVFDYIGHLRNVRENLNNQQRMLESQMTMLSTMLPSELVQQLNAAQHQVAMQHAYIHARKVPMPPQQRSIQPKSHIAPQQQAWPSTDTLDASSSSYDFASPATSDTTTITSPSAEYLSPFCFTLADMLSSDSIMTPFTQDQVLSSGVAGVTSELHIPGGGLGSSPGPGAAACDPESGGLLNLGW